jgi:hypothetical protein
LILSKRGGKSKERLVEYFYAETGKSIAKNEVARYYLGGT